MKIKYTCPIIITLIVTGGFLLFCSSPKTKHANKLKKNSVQIKVDSTQIEVDSTQISDTVYIFDKTKLRDIPHLKFDNIRVHKKTHIFNNKAKAYSELTINFDYPISSTNKLLKDSLTNLFIENCFPMSDIDKSPKTIIKEIVAEYTRSSKKEMEEEYDNREASGEQTEYIGEWLYCIEGRVKLHKKNLLIYRVDCTDRAGSSHGIHDIWCINIDLRNQHIMSLEDIFIGGFEKPLGKLIQYKSMLDEGLSKKEIEKEMKSQPEKSPSGNFYLEKDSITFLYNTMSYRTGSIETKLSYNDLTHLLKRNSIIEELRK